MHLSTQHQEVYLLRIVSTGDGLTYVVFFFQNETTAKTYIQFMTKILKEGEKFVAQEKKRLGKIISEGKVNEKKKQELSNRLNVLHSFVVKTKDEL